jgi:hypothetical protein
MVHGLLLKIPEARPFLSFSERDTHFIAPTDPFAIFFVHFTKQHEKIRGPSFHQAYQDMKRIDRSNMRYGCREDQESLWAPETDDTYDLDDGPVPILPDSFLDKTAPRLQSLELSFPGLPTLLLSATHLVHLRRLHIPSSGYIPPKAMATTLSALNHLELLCLNFRSPRPCPALETCRLPPPPLLRIIDSSSFPFCATRVFS